MRDPDCLQKLASSVRGGISADDTALLHRSSQRVGYWEMATRLGALASRVATGGLAAPPQYGWPSGGHGAGQIHNRMLYLVAPIRPLSPPRPLRFPLMAVPPAGRGRRTTFSKIDISIFRVHVRTKFSGEKHAF